MKILLVNLPPASDYDWSSTGTIYPATGIMLIGSILKQANYDVQFIDATLYKNYQIKILNLLGEDTIICFSVMSSQVSMAYKLSKMIKGNIWGRHLKASIIWGGIHPTLYPEQTIKSGVVDAVVTNEASQEVVNVIEKVQASKESFISTQPELDDIDSLPHFDFSMLEVDKYLNNCSVYEREFKRKGLRFMPILTGLGCCFRCRFCVNVILKRKYRTRSALSIVNEIEHLQKEYGATAFLFLDEDFCIDKNRLQEFIGLVKQRGLKFHARIWSRVSYFNQNKFCRQIRELDSIGVKSIAMGAENGAQGILDYIQKDITVKDIYRASYIIKKTAIAPRYSFMTGFDGETQEDTIKTYKVCADLSEDNSRTDIAGPFTFRFYPGSPLFDDMVKKYNIKIPENLNDWDLNPDGSFKLKIPYWKGYHKYTKVMNRYLSLCSWRLKGKDNWIRKVLLWRIRHGKGYKVDFLILRLLRKI